MDSNEGWLIVLRGTVEKAIDKMISEKVLSAFRILFDEMKPAIKNVDDVLFGFIYGHVIGKIDSIYVNFNREPTQKEIEEIFNAIKKRNIEIRSQIYQTKT